MEVVTACHGIEALRQYQAYSGAYQAIVTDNDMPQMNGLDFVRSVRDLGFQGRIVVMSGNLNSEKLLRFQDLGISGFFHKPFDIGMLATMLLR